MSQKGAYELLLDKIENACSVLSNLIDKTEKDVFDFSKISLEFKDRIESDYRNTSSYLKDWFTRYIYFKDDQMVLITGQVLRNRHDRIHTLLYQHERAGEAHLYQSDAKKCLSCCSVDGVNYEYRILVTRLKKAKYEQRLENLANLAEACGEKIEIITKHFNNAIGAIEDAMNIHYKKLKTLCIGSDSKVQRVEINMEPFLGETINGSCYNNRNQKEVFCRNGENNTNTLMNIRYHRHMLKAITAAQARSTTIEDYGELHVKYVSHSKVCTDDPEQHKLESLNPLMKLSEKALNRKVIDIQEVEDELYRLREEKRMKLGPNKNSAGHENKYDFLDLVHDSVGLSTECDPQPVDYGMGLFEVNLANSATAASQEMAVDLDVHASLKYFVETTNNTVDYLWNAIETQSMRSSRNSNSCVLLMSNPILYVRVQYHYMQTSGYRYKNELNDKLCSALIDTKIHLNRLPSTAAYLPMKCDVILDTVCEELWNFKYNAVKWDSCHTMSSTTSIHRIALYPMVLLVQDKRYDRGNIFEFGNNYMKTASQFNDNNDNKPLIDTDKCEKWVPTIYKVYCDRKNELFLKILMAFATGMDQRIYDSQDYFISTLFRSLLIFLQQFLIQPYGTNMTGDRPKNVFCWCRTCIDTRLDFRYISDWNESNINWVGRDGNIEEKYKIDKSNIPEEHVSSIQNSKCMLLYRFLICIQKQCKEYCINFIHNQYATGLNSNLECSTPVNDRVSMTIDSISHCTIYPFNDGFDFSNAYLDKGSRDIFGLFS